MAAVGMDVAGDTAGARRVNAPVCVMIVNEPSCFLPSRRGELPFILTMRRHPGGA
jgi:hypothetical protein